MTITAVERLVLNVAPIPLAWTPHFPIFASERFLRFAGDEYGWLGGTDDTGTLRCILPYTIVKKPGVRMVRFRSETIPMNGDLSVEKERLFLGNAMEYFRSKGADFVLPASNTALFRTYPAGADAAPYGTFVIDLRQSEETLLKNIHETFRYNIRRAVRDGVAVTRGGEHLETSYKLVKGTLDRSDVRFRSYDDYRKAIQSFGDNVEIFIVHKDGTPQGCMVAPYSMYGANTWYCGSLEQPALGAMHLLHWEAMQHFRKLGVQRFDFTGVRKDPDKGSKQEGIFNFKRRFGGQLIQGFIWKHRFSTIKFAAYNLAIRLMQGGDTIDLERCKLVDEVKTQPC